MSGDIPERQEENISEIDQETTEPPDYKVLLLPPSVGVVDFPNPKSSTKTLL